MHDPRLSCMRKDSLLQCMQVAAAQHRTPLIDPISFQCQTKLGFNFVEPLRYGRIWHWSQSERGESNLEWKKNTFILSNYNELVDILSSGMEMPYPPLVKAGQYKLVQGSTRFLSLVQDSISKYKISLIGTRQYRLLYWYMASPFLSSKCLLT